MAKKNSRKRAAKKASTRRVTKTAKKTIAKKRARQRSPLSFPCIPINQGEQQMFLFAAPGKLLWSLVRVNEREEDKDKGYQRIASEARLRRIAQYIDDGNSIPTSLLISFTHGRYDAARDRLLIPDRADAGWVIDGQHRLIGVHKSKQDLVLPVVGLLGLKEDEQIEYFVTINKEQKGVPSSLYLDLLKRLPPSRSETEAFKERAADLATQMRVDERSPFFGRIVVTTSPKRGELSITNFVRKVVPLIKRDGRLSAFNDDDRRRVIDNYYHGLAQAFPTEYKKADSIFFRTLGFGALVNLLPFFLDVTLSTRQGGFRVADVASMFKQIDHFDFTRWRQMGTGTAAELAAAEEMRLELEQATRSEEGIINL